MSDAIDRALSENHALIAAILDHHSSGRSVSAIALLERLQLNLEFIAAAAEHGLPIDPPSIPMPPAPTTPTAPPPVLPAAPVPALSAPIPGIIGRSTAARIAPAPNTVAQGIAGTAGSAAHGPPGTMYWSREEHSRFEEGMRMYGESGKDGKPNFKAIASHVGTRTPVQVRSHLQKVQKKARREERESDSAGDKDKGIEEGMSGGGG